ncbi:DUF2087 domain-containing protein [Phytomonospora endophytica]|uniref:DUF2087 domain-containing protein n=1 Tax=Phytomonospora endophytica TaxID=714109 RepID=A0A841G0A2_9ACTN|nr:DUF2087 domain-containing protein [Phytomonospora endophytica]MBB6039202.1 hypothetical protein [Phytomonospora endophytica]GIG67561.1 hypothetical protein Pen01_38560 [Phytomonospora endophytica]
MDSLELCGQLAEPARLRAFAAVVLGAGTSAEVAEAAGADAKSAVKALQRLIGSGIVTTGEDGRLTASADLFKEAARQAPATEPESLDDDPDRNAVLRNFVRDGRLLSLPSGFRKSRIVVEHIAERSFEPGVIYTEKQIDDVLKGWHADHASLRRYLVDHGIMTREDGRYWRSGGRVEV